ncbi:hypothetical protein PHLCEN_2v7420 [Hermanssonia centrifuga]|uniref:Uncharacterized protein n=1 Tax=Hermanssonia centrifuga TaxID=98765 RepID=A0A2R6NWN8_9APHY|nr:hypothetical protein PHLCEN_2v7420 [Hermanssonia centrifuga]
MSSLAKIQDFDIDENLGRCRVCPGAKWTKMSNLRAHEKQPRHQGLSNIYAAQAARAKAQSPPAHDIDELDEVATEEQLEWDYWEHQTIDSSFNDGETAPPDPKLKFMESVLATLRHSAQNGENLAGKDLLNEHAVALEEAMQGLNIIEAALWPHDEAPLPEDGDEVEAEFEDALLSHIPSPQEIAETFFGARNTTDDAYFPYPNKAMMKTDILLSSPRLRFSRAQREAVLAWGRDLGAKNVPSLYALEKFQAVSLQAVGNPTVKIEAASGNILYMNDPAELLKKLYAHPKTRSKIHSLPELTPNKIKEVWQAEKWLYEVPDELLTPMIRLQNKDFYVQELVYCENEKWFIPERFFEYEGLKYAVGHAVTTSSLLLQSMQSACQTQTASWHRD